MLVGDALEGMGHEGFMGKHTGKAVDRKGTCGLEGGIL